MINDSKNGNKRKQKSEVKIHFKIKFNPKSPNKARRAGNAAAQQGELPQNNSCRNQGSYDNRRYEVKFSRPPGIKARIAAASVAE